MGRLEARRESWWEPVLACVFNEEAKDLVNDPKHVEANFSCLRRRRTRPRALWSFLSVSVLVVTFVAMVRITLL